MAYKIIHSFKVTEVVHELRIPTDSKFEPGTYVLLKEIEEDKPDD